MQKIYTTKLITGIALSPVIKHIACIPIVDKILLHLCIRQWFTHQNFVKKKYFSGKVSLMHVSPLLNICFTVLF